jgi:hypothetical protein
MSFYQMDLVEPGLGHPEKPKREKMQTSFIFKESEMDENQPGNFRAKKQHGLQANSSRNKKTVNFMCLQNYLLHLKLS